VGQPSTASLYLQSAKPSASYLFASDLSELFLDADTPVDFLYMNNYQNPELMEEVFHICAQRVTLKSVFVVQGICYSKKMKTLWNQLKEDVRVRDDNGDLVTYPANLILQKPVRRLEGKEAESTQPE
jgi:hypothetical protein